MLPEEYFFDIKSNRPKPNQILVCYTSTAEFIHGDLKENIVDILISNPNGAELAMRILKSNAYATDYFSIRLALDMTEDLLSMTREEVLKKPYPYVLEINYWVDKVYWETCEYAKDPHFSTISILNSDEFHSKTTELEIKAKILNKTE